MKEASHVEGQGGCRYRIDERYRTRDRTRARLQGADLMINGFGEAAAIEEAAQGNPASHGVRVACSGADLSKAAR
jgi:hypothetical protein